MATAAQYESIIKAAAPGIDQVALGEHIISRARRKLGTGADAHLAQYGLSTRTVPSATWLGVDSSGTNMPTYGPIPAGAGEDCAICTLQAWAALAVLLEWAGSNDDLIAIAFAIFAMMLDDCPCDFTW